MPKSALPALEHRVVPLATRVIERAADGDTPAELRFTGHAAVFNQKTWIGPKRWGFWEEIDPGFFRDVLEDDAAYLINHDPNILLARNGETMTLSTDKRGLAVDAEWDPEDPEARMWAGRHRRGDIAKMSFAFTVQEEKWGEADDGEELRTLLTAERLYDVSSVVYPAYEGTDGGMRTDEAAGVVLRHRGFDPRTQEAPKRVDAALELQQARHKALARRERLQLTD